PGRRLGLRGAAAGRPGPPARRAPGPGPGAGERLAVLLRRAWHRSRRPRRDRHSPRRDGRPARRQGREARRQGREAYRAEREAYRAEREAYRAEREAYRQGRRDRPLESADRRPGRPGVTPPDTDGTSP